MRERFVLLCALLALTQIAATAQEPAFRYDEDARAWYRCFVRNSCVIVELKLIDSTEQEKMLRNGAAVWFDTKGRKNKKTGICFPLPTKTLVKTAPAAARPFAHDMHLIGAAREMKLSGFPESINGIQNQHHPSGISAGLRYLNDTLIYSAQLPLNILAPSGELTSKLAVGIVINGSSEPFAMMPPEGPMDTGAPPGPPPGESGRNVRLLEHDEFWCKLVVFKDDRRMPLQVTESRDKNK